jgi:hypothetical protein
MWRKGYTVNTVFTCCYWTLFVVAQLLWYRDRRRRRSSSKAAMKQRGFAWRRKSRAPLSMWRRVRR